MHRPGVAMYKRLYQNKGKLFGTWKAEKGNVFNLGVLEYCVQCVVFSLPSSYKILKLLF